MIDNDWFEALAAIHTFIPYFFGFAGIYWHKGTPPFKAYHSFMDWYVLSRFKNRQWLHMVTAVII